MGRGVVAVLAATVAVFTVAAAEADAARVHAVTPVSDKTPFDPCPFSAPLPFTGRVWNPPDTAQEPSIAVDPNNPDRIASAWMQDFAGGIVVGFTSDGGKTWRRSIVPGISKCSGSGEEGAAADPRVTFGPDGTLLLSAMANIVLELGRTTPNDAVVVTSSPDGGKTWRKATVVEPQNGYNDWPFVAVAPDDPKRVYITFTKATEPVGNALFTMFASSSDGGRTFDSPRPIFRSIDNTAFYYSNGSLVAQSGGRLTAVLWNFEGVNYFPVVPDLIPSKIKAINSGDGGKSWSAPVTVGEQTPFYDTRDEESGKDIRAGAAPSTGLGADGSLWVVWNDFDGPRGRAMLAQRHPDGRWEQPREVLPWSDRRILFPLIAQAPSGELGLMWFDDRNDLPKDEQYKVDAWFALSRDQGRSFDAPLHLAGPMDFNKAWADARGGEKENERFVGDYMAMTATKRGFLGALVFTDPVTQLELAYSQLFVADVRLAAAARPAPRVTPPPTGAGDSAALAAALARERSRARAFRGCLLRAARHTRLDLAATRRGSLRARALARRHLRRHRAGMRRRCVARYGRTPGQVTGLSASAIARKEFVLSFRAPGSDRNRPPPARSYVVKQSRTPIRDLRGFRAAQPLCGGACRFSVTRVGEQVKLRIADRRPRTNYYYAIAARDNVTRRLGPRSKTLRVRTK